MTNPAIRNLLEGLGLNSAFQKLVGEIRKDPFAHSRLSGLNPTAKALYSVLLWQAFERPVIVVVDGIQQAETLGETVETLFDLVGGGQT